MPRPFLVCGLVVACVLSGSSSAAPAGARQGPGADLREVQRGLDEVTFRIRVSTAAWLALEPSVHETQAELRRKPRSPRPLRTLTRLLPSWLAIKRDLHADYRRVRALLADARRVTNRVGRRRWREAWPLRLRPQELFQACPVQGPIALPDTFGAPRPGGRIHEGVDLFSARGTPLVAVQPGVVRRAGNSLGGRAVILRSGSGYSYYAHLSAYGATGPVRPGEVIGYVGASGDAKGLITHLHFEWHPGGDAAVDAFPFLQAVC